MKERVQNMENKNLKEIIWSMTHMIYQQNDGAGVIRSCMKPEHVNIICDIIQEKADCSFKNEERLFESVIKSIRGV